MLDALRDLVLPAACAGCRSPGRRVCPDCLDLLTSAVVGPVRPSPCPAGLPPVTTACHYDGPVRGLLVAHKEHGALHLTRPLGAALAAAVTVHGRSHLLLVPVPSARSAVRARGHDHSRRLALAAAGALRAAGVDAEVATLLHPTRRVRDQAGLDRHDRAANLAGALRAEASPGLPVLVVDDLMTTGATLVEAARALREQGHPVVGASVVATTRRRPFGPDTA